MKIAQREFHCTWLIGKLEYGSKLIFECVVLEDHHRHMYITTTNTWTMLYAKVEAVHKP